MVTLRGSGRTLFFQVFYGGGQQGRYGQGLLNIVRHPGVVALSMAQSKWTTTEISKEKQDSIKLTLFSRKVIRLNVCNQVRFYN
jgi:hypothetical protein